MAANDLATSAFENHKGSIWRDLDQHVGLCIHMHVYMHTHKKQQALFCTVKNHIVRTFEPRTLSTSKCRSCSVSDNK